jgi:hypothetical protein
MFPFMFLFFRFVARSHGRPGWGIFAIFAEDVRLRIIEGLTMFYNCSIVACICLHVIHLGKSTVRMPMHVSRRGAGAVWLREEANGGDVL